MPAARAGVRVGLGVRHPVQPNGPKEAIIGRLGHLRGTAFGFRSYPK